MKKYSLYIIIGLLIFIGFVILMCLGEINYQGMDCKKYETVCRKYIGFGIWTQTIQIDCSSNAVEIKKLECVNWVSKRSK